MKHFYSFQIRFYALLFVVTGLLMACTAAPVDNTAQSVATIVATTVPIEPTIAPTKASAATVEPSVNKSSADDLSDFVMQLETAVTNQDYILMETLMSDPLAIGGWRSEWRMYKPVQAIAQFQNNSLPVPMNVQFTGLSDDEITNLIGQTPASMFGPVSPVVAALHSAGWGQAAADEAIVFVAEEDGRYSWYAFLYTDGRFASDSTPITIDEASVNYVIAMQDVPMYSGDNDGYEQIGFIADGQTALVTGQSADSGWWRVICPDDTIGNCWLTNDEAFTVPTSG